jgi:glycosyltransferase involved in cell wall biosynthesis
MRILHIISRMDPVGGGPQEVVRLLLRYAPADVHQEVVTLDDPAAPFLQNETATIHALGGSGQRFAAPHLTRWLTANRDRFDGIILHGMWEYASFAVLRSIAGHKPYVVFAHGMLDPYFKRASLAKHLKKWLYWLPVQYWTLRRAHRVLFTTTAERDLATHSFSLHQWKPMVVAIGAEAPPTDLTTCAEAFFDLCPTLRDKRFLLFLGRIDPKKGCDLLVEAFGSLKQHPTSDPVEICHLDRSQTASSFGVVERPAFEPGTAPDLHLVIAGPDPLGWTRTLDDLGLAHCVEHFIHFPGMLTGDAKWGAFAASEAFILPSHQENFGIAVVEALACGKPVLITRAINIAADLEADGCALVEDDTLQGTQNLITRWLALTPEQKAAMSNAARTTFATRYDMRRNTRAIMNCFEDCP